MSEARDDWWVIAGAAVALHGAEGPSVSDVDVLASERDATALLTGLGLHPVSAGPHPLFRSKLLGRIDTAPLIIEIMAGFCVRSAEGWRAVKPQSRLRFELQDCSLFAPSRPELQQMLRDMGRPKDLARADLLEIKKS